MELISCMLPGGYVDKEGTVHKDVYLAPLSGGEEEFLAEKRNKEGSAYLVTAILSRSVRSIGSISSISEDITSNLLIADRQYLLLKLRQATFGDKVYATIQCPWPDCGRKLDIDFSIENIPVIHSEDKGPLYSLELSPEKALSVKQAALRKIVFRLPNGGDQEILSPLIYENEAKALTMLLTRCIKAIGTYEDPGYELVSKLSPLARMEIEKKMEEIAPKVQLTLKAHCPECNREFEVPFDIQDFFFGELRTSMDLLYREVHYLAYHYHWSEKEIMEMPRDKRRRYIEVLADEIESLNNAD